VASERRQLALLGAIVVVFIIVVWWQLTRDDAGTPVAQSATAAAPLPAGRSVTGTAAATVPAVALPLLKMDGAEPVDTGRDPFHFDNARSVPAGGPGRPVGQPAAPLVQRPMQPVAPAEPAGPPPPPPITLRYIGMAKQGGGKQLAVLRDEKGVYYGAEGDVIEGRYRLLRVSQDSVDVAYVDGRGRRTIPLSGGRP
jgi:hypothetical protein